MVERCLYVAVVLIVVAVLYELYQPYCKDDLLIQKISRSWSERIGKPENKRFSSIVIGVNANIDMIVSAKSLLLALEASPSVAVDHDVLSSVADLEQLVAYSMTHCAGIERSFLDKDLFDNIVETGTSVAHKYHVGGNAALMAEKFKNLEPSARVVLVGVIGSRLKEVFSEELETPNFNASTKEEIHMILEYSVSEQWAGITSSCANRVIFSHDVSNSRMLALDDVSEVVEQIVPDLVVLSGAHLLESQTEPFWTQRLDDSSRILEAIVTPVHWELASVGNLKFFSSLALKLFPKVESLGLNEQELLSVAKSCNAPFNFATLPSKPSVGVVSDLLHWLMLTFGSHNKSVLGRVHLHSLSFHIIVVKDKGAWLNTRAAVMAGAREAGLQACGTTTFNSSMFKLLLPGKFYASSSDPNLSQLLLSAGNGWAEWSRDGFFYYLSPVLVCRSPSRTVGLGDAISASGLLHSQFM